MSDALSLVVGVGLAIAGVLAIYIWIKNRTRKVTYLRLYVQLVSFFTIFFTVIILAKWNSLVYAVIILVLPIFIGRFFCGWLCPFAFYMDLISLVRKAMRVRHRSLPDRLNKALHKVRYVVAASMLTLPFFFNALDLQTWAQFIQFAGPFKPLNSFLIGPLETLVTPFPGTIEFSGYSLTYPYIRGILTYVNVGAAEVTTALAILFIAVTVVGAFVFRRFWCRFCPTGVSIAAVNKYKALRGIPIVRLNKVEEKCTKCGVCKRVCPVQVTEVYDEKGGDITTQMCMLCTRCVEMCPYEGCLRVQAAGRTIFKSRNWLEPSKSE
ncbi:MAG: 4Fe-4S binding protein [Candidatus Bathyarchaeia archaeon]